MSQHEVDMAAKEKARSEIMSSSVTMPGAQAVSKDDASRIDDRIAAKSSGYSPSTAVAAAASSTSNTRTTTMTDAEAKAQAREGSGAVVPGVEAVKRRSSLDDLDDRIQQKTFAHSSSASDLKDDDDDDLMNMESAAALPINTNHNYDNDDEYNNNNNEKEKAFEAKDKISNPIIDIDPSSLEYGEYDTYAKGGGGLVEAVQVNDDELQDDDFFIPAAEEYDPNSKFPPLFQNPKFRLCALCTLVSVITLTVGLSVGLTKSLNTEETLVNATHAPSATPTAAPTSYRDTIGIREYLQPFYFSYTSSKQDSAQYKATDWIINQDPLQLTLEQHKDDNLLLQRWSLAVLAFATSSASWKVCGTVPPYYVHHQNQDAVKCKIEDTTTGQKKEYEVSYWLSSFHECTWFGVTCDDDNQVVELKLANNRLIGTFPPELTYLKNLRTLHLHANNLHGTLPPQITSFHKTINDLQLHLNEFQGPIPQELYDLTNLQSLNVGMNDFTGTISSRIGNLENLKGLMLFDMGLNGRIPSEIGLLDKLNFLWLHNNAFTGTIPNEITKLTGLRDWRNQGTLVTGTIPRDIGNLVDLEILFLSECRLSGPLPPSFYNLINLQHFHAWNNRNLLDEPMSPGLNGTISTDIGNMKELISFVVKNNWFQGQLPDEFGLLTELQTADFNFNDVTGASPFCNPINPNAKRQASYEALQMDCAENMNGISKVQCKCCTECCLHETGVCRNQ